MAARFTRMREGCNRLNTTDDDLITIYFGCIFSWCVNACEVKSLKIGTRTVDEKIAFKNKCSEFLGLPLVADSYDGLRFSIGHRLHGQLMRTGWLFNAKSLEDRRDDLSNLLVESWTSNICKLNFPTTTYPSLKKMISEIVVPRELYDPARIVHQLPESLKVKLDPLEVKEEDGFDFEDDISSSWTARLGFSSHTLSLDNDDDMQDYEGAEVYEDQGEGEAEIKYEGMGKGRA